MNTPHKHAAPMAEYAADAAETERPWERWQHKSTSETEWKPMVHHPTWQPICEYRRKPKTININGFEVPEPLRVAPEIGELYYAVNPPYASTLRWNNDNIDNAYLDAGMIHSDKESAQLHAKALISFTAKGDA